MTVVTDRVVAQRTSAARSQGPIRIGDILAGLAPQLRANRDPEGDRPAPASPAQPPEKREPEQRAQVASRSHAVMETNLARRGVWSLGGPDPTPATAQLRLEQQDLLGKLVIHAGAGRLTTWDMEVLSYLLGLWVTAGMPDCPDVHFTYREAARAFGVAFSGQWAACLRSSLLRLDATRFRMEVHSFRRQTRALRTFGIVDWLSLNGPLEDDDERTETRVVVRLHQFVWEQLRAGGFRRISWEVLRHGVRSDLAKRLYVWVEAQKGFGHDHHYSHTITPDLLATLGCTDRKLRRVRQKMERACIEIVSADSRYTGAGLRQNGEGAWIVFFERGRASNARSARPPDVGEQGSQAAATL